MRLTRIGGRIEGIGSKEQEMEFGEFFLEVLLYLVKPIVLVWEFIFWMTNGNGQE